MARCKQYQRKLACLGQRRGRKPRNSKRKIPFLCFNCNSWSGSGNRLSRVCLCVCMYVCVLWKPWPSKFVFGLQIQFSGYTGHVRVWKYRVKITCVQCDLATLPHFSAFYHIMTPQIRHGNPRECSELQVLGWRQKFLSVLPHNLDTAARRFSVAAPRLWNSLPLNCRTASSVITFKTRLKTFLFASA